MFSSLLGAILLAVGGPGTRPPTPHSPLTLHTAQQRVCMFHRVRLIVRFTRGTHTFSFFSFFNHYYSCSFFLFFVHNHDMVVRFLFFTFTLRNRSFRFNPFSINEERIYSFVSNTRAFRLFILYSCLSLFCLLYLFFRLYRAIRIEWREMVKERIVFRRQDQGKSRDGNYFLSGRREGKSGRDQQLAGQNLVISRVIEQFSTC